MDISLLVLVMAIVLQLATAIYALYLFKITERKVGWLLISVAFVVMIARRCFSIYNLLDTDSFAISFFNEILGLLISLLMFIGTVTIKKYFTSILETRQDLITSEIKLKKANAAKDRLFSIIAHDLKNPFGTMLNFSDLLLHDLDSFSRDKIRDFLNRINRSTKQAYLLLENLLSWSLSQLSQLETHPQELDLETLISDVILLLNSTAEEKQLTILKNVPRQSKAYADENMTASIIRNLLSNAIKFTPRSGRIEIIVTNAEPDVKITVRDNGIGLPADKIKSLFENGRRESSEGTEKEKGTGLGLIICQEFASRNRGRLEFNSTLGKGTEISLYLPAIG